MGCLIADVGPVVRCHHALHTRLDAGLHQRAVPVLRREAEHEHHGVLAAEDALHLLVRVVISHANDVGALGKGGRGAVAGDDGDVEGRIGLYGAEDEGAEVAGGLGVASLAKEDHGEDKPTPTIAMFRRAEAMVLR